MYPLFGVRKLYQDTSIALSLALIVKLNLNGFSMAVWHREQQKKIENKLTFYATKKG